MSVVSGDRSRWSSVFQHLRAESVSADTPGPGDFRALSGRDSAVSGFPRPVSFVPAAHTIQEADETGRSSEGSGSRKADARSNPRSIGTVVKKNNLPAPPVFGSPVPMGSPSPTRSRFFKPEGDDDRPISRDRSRQSRLASLADSEEPGAHRSVSVALGGRKSSELPDPPGYKGLQGGVSVRQPRFFKELRPQNAGKGAEAPAAEGAKAGKSPKAQRYWSVPAQERRKTVLLSTHGGRREYANVDEGKADLEKLNLQVQVRELSAELELARQEEKRRREREEKEAAQREREAEVASSPGSAHSPRGVVAPQFLPPQGVPHLSHANVPFVHAAAREALHTDTLGGSRRWRAGIGPAVQVKTPPAWNGYLRHTHSLRPVAVVDPAVGVVGYDDSLLKREEPTRFNRIARSLSLRPTLPPRAQSNQSLKASPRRGSMHPALRGRGETESKRAYAVTSESVPALYPPPVTTSRATEPSLQAQMYARALKPYPFQPAVTFECRPLLAVHHHGDVPQQPDTPLIGRAPFACAGEWDDGWDDAVRQYQSAEWDDGWDAVVPSPQQRQPPVQYVAPPLPPPPQLPVQYAQEPQREWTQTLPESRYDSASGPSLFSPMTSSRTVDSESIGTHTAYRLLDELVDALGSSSDSSRSTVSDGERRRREKRHRQRHHSSRRRKEEGREKSGGHRRRSSDLSDSVKRGDRRHRHPPPSVSSFPSANSTIPPPPRHHKDRKPASVYTATTASVSSSRRSPRSAAQPEKGKALQRQASSRTTSPRPATLPPPPATKTVESSGGTGSLSKRIGERQGSAFVLPSASGTQPASASRKAIVQRFGTSITRDDEPLTTPVSPYPTVKPTANGKPSVFDVKPRVASATGAKQQPTVITRPSTAVTEDGFIDFGAVDDETDTNPSPRPPIPSNGSSSTFVQPFKTVPLMSPVQEGPRRILKPRAASSASSATRSSAQQRVLQRELAKMEEERRAKEARLVAERERRRRI